MEVTSRQLKRLSNQTQLHFAQMGKSTVFRIKLLVYPTTFPAQVLVQVHNDKLLRTVTRIFSESKSAMKSSSGQGTSIRRVFWILASDTFQDEKRKQAFPPFFSRSSLTQSAEVAVSLKSSLQMNVSSGNFGRGREEGGYRGD